MPTQVKLLLGALIAAAGLIVAAFSINVSNLTGLGANIFNALDYEKTTKDGGKSEKTYNFSNQSDIDKDGLFDYEEVLYGTDPLNPDTDSDGFLDGEEIASKRNPLIKGPDDQIGDNNLTKKISELAIAGLMEGSLKPDNPNYIRSLNLVVDEIVRQSQISLFPNRVSINIVPDSYETVKEYNDKTVPIMESLVEEEGKSILELVDLVDATDFFDDSKLNPQNKSFQSLRNFASKRVNDLGLDLSILETSPVPQILSEQHKFFVKTYKNIALSYSHLTEADSDPVQAMMSFRNIIVVFTEELPKLNESR